MLILVLLSRQAAATWSIVAADAGSGQVGGAVTSCVGTLDTVVVFGGVPGVGAVHAQAQLSTAGRDEAMRLLAEGVAPEQIIEEITSFDFDMSASNRQYGVVDLQGRAAAYTGATNGDWAGDRQGEVGGIAWSAQGNILTSEAVVAQTAAAFEAEGCDLADRLMRGLEAGASGGEGDNRCTGNGIASDSASITVQAADGSDVLRLTVVDTSPESAVVLLRAQFDGWREDNACPQAEEPTDSGGEGTEATGCGCAAGGGGGGGGGKGLWALVPLLLLSSLRRSGHSARRGSDTRGEL